MDKKLFDLIGEQIPKMNDLLINGLAVDQMRLVEQYVHRIMQTAAGDFPPELRYEGYRRCTPQEEYAELTRKTNGRATHDLARSDLYMVKYFFSFNGEMLEPRYLQLPFVGDAGIMHLRGSIFSVAPVLADKAISVGPDFIFVPLNRAKLTFKRKPHPVYVNGKLEQHSVVWSKIYNQSQKNKDNLAKSSVRRTETSLVHYMFAKFGVHETFARYANSEVVVGDSKNITPEQYPPEEWFVYSSSLVKPVGVHDTSYVGSDLHLAIRKDHHNRDAAALASGFFYVVDHFPHRVLPEYIGAEGEQSLWRILLGALLFGDGLGDGKLLEDTNTHLDSLDSYVDQESKMYLQDDGLFCESIYDLLMEIIQSFAQRVTQSTHMLASMYDKRLMLLRYALRDLTTAINTFMFRVKKVEKRAMTKKDVLKHLRDKLKTNTVMKMNSSHTEIMSASGPGDSKYFKFTSTLVPQSETSRGRKSKSKVNPNDPSNYLHVSIAEAGSYNTMSKSEPTGRSKINPWLQIDRDNGLIIRNPNRVELLDRTQRMLQRQ